ncbi:hypothetical protein J6590_044887 [Homalodisca vitripennis]|nr:hypothetical protein J6590_044887 [Homalodisca vitripennis]
MVNLWFLMMKQILGAVPMFEDRMSATQCHVGRSGIAISPTAHVYYQRDMEFHHLIINMYSLCIMKKSVVPHDETNPGSGTNV